jgi:hypothetical protein
MTADRHKPALDRVPWSVARPPLSTISSLKNEARFGVRFRVRNVVRIEARYKVRFEVRYGTRALAFSLS